MPSLIPDELKRILSETPLLQQSYVVGGSVRDWLLGISHKDYDIEVFGVSYDQLVAALSSWGKTDLVGRSFGVAKLTTGSGFNFDFTIPRRDSKVGPGHKGFEVTFDASITPREAAARRDFTINALMYDPRADAVLDFFGGQEDLRNRVLRHTSDAFREDPLRVLRGMQLCARFVLTPPTATIALCRAMKEGYRELATERVKEEWFKWAARSARPSAGLQFLAVTEWIEHFPEVAALMGTPQDPEWHPEGDVFVHTCHCCDALVELPEWRSADEESRIVYSLATLAHDFAKPQTTVTALKEGRTRIVSPGHEEAGGAMATQFLERIQAPHHIRDRIVPLVTNHLAHLNDVTDRSVRRLAKRLEPANIQDLSVVMIADHFGRPPLPRIIPEGVTRLRAKAAELHVQASAPKPILMGRHLIDLGLAPGKSFGAVLHEAFEAQLEGEFGDLPGAWRWLAQQTDLDLSPEAKGKLETNTKWTPSA